ASAPGGRVLALDADPAAIERGRVLQAEAGDRLVLRQGNFAGLAGFAGGAGVAPLDGILLDLGLSSYQLDDPAGGFSFTGDGPLDMRFGPGVTETAADLVNGRDEGELADLIFRYGDERWGRRIARAIVRERGRAPIESTGALAAIVAGAVASAG